jgi:hypothetical protein
MLSQRPNNLVAKVLLVSWHADLILKIQTIVPPSGSPAAHIQRFLFINIMKWGIFMKMRYSMLTSLVAHSDLRRTQRIDGLLWP